MRVNVIMSLTCILYRALFISIHSCNRLCLPLSLCLSIHIDTHLAYLLTMKGIFFSLSSFMAISSGSVSPSGSTMTGAFIDICSARVPSTRAFSYLVMYRVVMRCLGACGCAPPAPPAPPSPCAHVCQKKMRENDTQVDVQEHMDWPIICLLGTQSQLCDYFSC